MKDPVRGYVWLFVVVVVIGCLAGAGTEIHLLHVADPEGFLVGELDGEPIATVSGVRYSDDFAFLGCYIVSTGEGIPYRVHVRAPSFYNLQALPIMMADSLVADTIATIASLDPVMGDVDR